MLSGGAMRVLQNRTGNRNGNGRRGPVSIVTSRDLPASREAVWKKLLFFEEVAESPPFFLRGFLPRPLGTEGCKAEVGGQVTCRYVGGHLLKRVTRVIHGHSYSFEVVEQDLGLPGIRLLGGDYLLRQLAKGRTRVVLATRYESLNRPRWLYERVEAVVCHSFHRHILSAMSTQVCAEK